MHVQYVATHVEEELRQGRNRIVMLLTLALSFHSRAVVRESEKPSGRTRLLIPALCYSRDGCYLG
jgi:hypothetical protein